MFLGFQRSQFLLLFSISFFGCEEKNHADCGSKRSEVVVSLADVEIRRPAKKKVQDFLGNWTNDSLGESGPSVYFFDGLRIVSLPKELEISKRDEMFIETNLPVDSVLFVDGERAKNFSYYVELKDSFLVVKGLVDNEKMIFSIIGKYFRNIQSK